MVSSIKNTIKKKVCIEPSKVSPDDSFATFVNKKFNEKKIKKDISHPDGYYTHFSFLDVKSNPALNGKSKIVSSEYNNSGPISNVSKYSSRTGEKKRIALEGIGHKLLYRTPEKEMSAAQSSTSLFKRKVDDSAAYIHSPQHSQLAHQLTKEPSLIVDDTSLRKHTDFNFTSHSVSKNTSHHPSTDNSLTIKYGLDSWDYKPSVSVRIHSNILSAKKAVVSSDVITSEILAQHSALFKGNSILTFEQQEQNERQGSGMYYQPEDNDE